MTNKLLAEKLGFKVFNQGEEKEVTCGYCGDLLSWVMGKAESECAWITVMNNINVAAVAVLRDVSCIILAEGVQPDANLLAKAESEDLALFGSDMHSFQLAVEISALIKNGN